MAHVHALFQVLKQQLRAQGKTYADLAAALHLSESSVKRQFAAHNMQLDRLLAVCDYLQISLGELTQLAEHRQPQVKSLSLAQETALMNDPKLLLVAVCAMNHWPVAEIVAHYQIELPECILKLTQLDKMGFLNLLPHNRIRLNLSRDFAWQAHGPIQRYLRQEGVNDFFAESFAQGDSELMFAHAMLSDDACLKMQDSLRRCRQQLAQAHEESLALPQHHKRGMAMILALRAWEPLWFRQLRRQPQPSKQPV